MALDPSTASAWANVFGGGLSGAVIAALGLGNVWQFILYRRDKARAEDALAAANAAHLETAKSVSVIAQEFAVAMDALRHRRERAQAPQRKEGGT